MATEYFFINEGGQQGPCSREQMEAALARGDFSAGAEFRVGERGAWLPIAALGDELARTDRAPESAGLRPPGMRSPREALVIVLLIAAAVGGVSWKRAERKDLMGKPCRTDDDCGHGSTCLQLLNEDRSIRSGGYCTFECGRLWTCKAGMSCGDVLEGGASHGVAWDGTYTRHVEVCLKR